LATGDCDAKTPWAKIGENPDLFFDSDSYPAGFKFEDPSRMGKEVKKLVEHLRERQKTMGVNAFHFKNIWKDKKFEKSKYPEAAKQAIDAGDDVLNWEIPTDLSDLSEVDPPIRDEVGKAKADTQDQSRIPPPESQNKGSAKMADRIVQEEWTADRQLPTLFTDALPTLEMESSNSHVDLYTADDSADWSNIDPRLRPHATNLPPDGDPFPHSKKYPTDIGVPNVGSSKPTFNPPCPQFPTETKPPLFQCSPLPPKIIPPHFSATSTPARTPKKRKRSEYETLETPTLARPKRQIVTPKRYVENAST
jgi:hypothetical protein